MREFDLDMPLMRLLASDGTDYWTIRDAIEGVQIFGGIGSGKTSGSGKTLMAKYLANGFGGLVLTVKPDEKQMWEELCRLTGREKDLVIIGPNTPHRFNFIDYEIESGPDGLNDTGNIVDVLKTVINAGEAQDSGTKDDPFWESSLDLLIFNVIDLCKLAYGKLSVQEMFDIVQSIPKSATSNQSQEKSTKAFHRAFEAARLNVTAQIDAWYTTLSEEEQSRLKDDTLFESELLEAIPDARLMKFVDGFFLDTFASVSDKTQATIELSFSGFLFRLLREPFYSLFCRYPSTVTPEDCLDGKIILIDLPVKLYQKAGRDSQLLAKYVFQKSWEKRDVKKNPRPVFLWADEAQTFIHEKDADFQATARSSRVATVYLSQNLPNYLACMGGQKSEYRVQSFLGTLGTKFFHANSCTQTNSFSSQLFGEAYFLDTSKTDTIGEKLSQAFSKSFHLKRVVRPEQFINLKTGGPRNNFQVEAYLHRQGNSFLNGCNYRKVRFNQTH